MKKVTNAEVLNPFSGKPLQITDPDAEVTPEEWDEAPTNAADREVWVADWNRRHQVPLTTLHAARMFVGNLRDLKASDGAKAFAIIKALRRSQDRGYIELEDDHYDWLVKTFEEKGADLFPRALDVATVLDSFRQLHQDDAKGRATLELVEGLSA